MLVLIDTNRVENIKKYKQIIQKNMLDDNKLSTLFAKSSSNNELLPLAMQTMSALCHTWLAIVAEKQNDTSSS